MFTASLLTTTPATAAASAQATTSIATSASGGIRPAADLSRFRPGYIISDSLFTSANTMDAGQIQAFLQSKVSSCQSGYVCLKDFRINSVDRAADRYCNGYSGVRNELASSIIARAAQSCGINPQVLLVMLQKEQGLITHTWPSQWRYDAALGQGCPDDAPCDPGFVGFFHQIYGAARQMKIYMEGIYFTWYAPGNWWNIRYNPDQGCGSSPVYIENAATSSLYYYTPYQPNRAALDAGYGEGDYCSAYGNRNFFNYFSDWFGDPTRPAGPYLVRAADADPIYLVADGVRYHIMTADDLALYVSRFGAFRIAPSSTVNAMPTGAAVNRTARDARDGRIYLLESDSTKHHFPTVDRMNLFGYPAQNAATLPPSIIDAFTTGAGVGTVFRIGSTSAVWLADGGGKRHIYDQTALSGQLSSQNTYVAVMTADAGNRLPTGATYFGASRLIRGDGNPQVYLTTATATLVHVPSLDLGARFGAKGGVTVVDPGAIAPGNVAGDQLLPVVVCGAQTRAVDGAGLRLVASGAAGTRATRLSDADCGAFPAASGQAAAGPVFVARQGTAELYTFDQGVIRHVWSYQDLLAIKGSVPLTTLTWSDATMNDYGVGDPLRAREGAVLRFGTESQAYLMRNGILRHVASWEALVALVGPNPVIDARPASQRSAFTFGTAILQERAFVRFGSDPATYLFSDGQLHHLRTWGTLLAENNGTIPPVQSLPGSVLTSFSVGSPLLANGSIVRFGTATPVYVMQNGLLRPVATDEALLNLGGGKIPPIDSIPGGPEDFKAGPPIT